MPITEDGRKNPSPGPSPTRGGEKTPAFSPFPLPPSEIAEASERGGLAGDGGRGVRFIRPV